jgi:hypothetical protein
MSQRSLAQRSSRLNIFRMEGSALGLLRLGGKPVTKYLTIFITIELYYSFLVQFSTYG